MHPRCAAYAGGAYSSLGHSPPSLHCVGLGECVTHSCTLGAWCMLGECMGKGIQVRLVRFFCGDLAALHVIGNHRAWAIQVRLVRFFLRRSGSPASSCGALRQIVRFRTAIWQPCTLSATTPCMGRRESRMSLSFRFSTRLSRILFPSRIGSNFESIFWFKESNPVLMLAFCIPAIRISKFFPKSITRWIIRTTRSPQGRPVF